MCTSTHGMLFTYWLQPKDRQCKLSTWPHCQERNAYRGGSAFHVIESVSVARYTYNDAELCTYVCVFSAGAMRALLLSRDGQESGYLHVAGDGRTPRYLLGSPLGISANHTTCAHRIRVYATTMPQHSRHHTTLIIALIHVHIGYRSMPQLCHNIPDTIQP